MSTLVIELSRKGWNVSNPDLVVFRRGTITFAAFVLFDNLLGIGFSLPKLEPMGFVAFLGSMGYVAWTPTLFGEIIS